jgi:toxin-antitoxin system PIN domain toxin
MSREAALVDTNVLVYALFEDAPQHRASRALLTSCERGGQPLVVSPQNLMELYATVTNPRRVTAPYTPRDAIEVVREILDITHLWVIPVPPDIHERVLLLLEAHPVAGRKCFDLQLVATALASGVGRVYTYNLPDFKSTPIVAAEP